MVVVPPSSFVLALPYCFKHQYGSADTYIQRVYLSQHWDADMSIGCLAPLVGQSVVLSPHDNSCATGHVSIVIKMGVL